jgi:microcystin degradation protein MlrC
VRRVGVVGMFLESNAFARTVDEGRFRGLYLESDEVTVDARSDHPRQMLEVVGFYDEMDRHGPWEPVPILVTMGGAGGAADHGFFVDTLERVRVALDEAGLLDAVYLCNHGAMITTEEEDGDGLFFAAVRDAVGPEVPLVGTLDPHGNVSDAMVDALDVVVAYRTDPHVDQRERGAEAAQLLREVWDGMTPHTVLVKVPIVAPNVALFTDHGPFAELVDTGQQRVNSGICNVSISGGSHSPTPRRTAWQSSLPVATTSQRPATWHATSPTRHGRTATGSSPSRSPSTRPSNSRSPLVATRRCRRW